MSSESLSRVIRRPLAGVALAFAFGIATGFRIYPNLCAVGPLMAILTVLTYIYARYRFSTALLLVSVFLAGWWRGGESVRNERENALRSYFLRPRQGVEVQVRLLEPAQWLGDREGRARVLKFAAAIEAIRGTQGWEKADGVAWIIWRNGAWTSQPAYGERWCLAGVMEQVPSITTWWGPARRLIVSGSGEQIWPAGGSRFLAWCFRLRDSGARRLRFGLPESERSPDFVAALLLGDRANITEDVRDAFATTGMLHVLAVSGLHVGLVVYVLIVLLQCWGIGRQKSVWVIAPALVVYSVMVGLRASAIRASVMSAILLLAGSLRRRPDVISAVSLAGIIILAVCPGQLRDQAFILSFVAVMALVVIGSKLSQALPEPSGSTTDQDWTIEPPTRFRAMVSAVEWWVRGMLIASFAAWCATVPLIARWFHVFSPVSPLANLIVIPLAFLILVSGMLSLLLGLVHPALSVVFNFANAVLVRVLLWCVKGMAGIPGAFWRVASWPEEWSILWYGAVFLALTSRGILRRAMPFLVSVCILTIMVWSTYDASRATVSVLEPTDAGVILVRAPWGRSVLIHSGPDFLASRVIRSLRNHGISALDALVLAEADAEHAGGAAEVIRKLPVREVWCSPWVRASRATMNALHEARRRNVRVKRLTAGEIAYVGPIGFEVLYPSGRRAVSNRAEPLVLRAQWGRSALLIAGGATVEVETAILAGALDPGAEMLIIGGRTLRAACSPAWLDAVRPSMVLISMGSEGRWVEPSSSWVHELRKRGVQVLRADQEGELTFEWRPRVTEPTGFIRKKSVARPELL